MNSTTPSNVIDFPTAKSVDSVESPVEENETTAEDIQIWSALTLCSLERQLTGHEEDPKFSKARELVDEISRKFALAGPIEIADYFQAIQEVASINASIRFAQSQELAA